MQLEAIRVVFIIASNNLGNAMTQYLKPYSEYLLRMKPHGISNNLLGNTLDINKLCYSTVLYAVQGFVYYDSQTVPA